MDAKALAKAIVAAQQELAAQGQAHAYAHVEHARKSAGRLAWIFFGVTLVASLIPMFLLREPEVSVSQATQIAGVAEVPAIPELAQQAAAGPRVTWDSVGGPPQLIDWGDSQGFLGRTREIRNGDQLYFDAFDADTVKRKWRIGPLGTYGQGYRHTHAQVLGERVVVSDHQAKLYIHNAGDGELLKQHNLSDRVKQLCVPKDSNGHTLWVGQVDERSHMLDTKTGELAEAPRPESCPKHRHLRKPKLDVPKVDGFDAERVHRDGDIAVAAGTKSPGTAYPRAVGFDQATKKVLWDQEIAAVDRATVRENSNKAEGLADGRFISIYGSGQDFWHLTALDAATGARLWDTQLRPVFAVDRVDEVVVSGSYVFVTRTSSLEVFAAKTGKLLGTVGAETYDK